MPRKRSNLWDILPENLQQLVDSCESVSDLCRKLKLDPANGSVRTLYKVLAAKGISYEKMRTNASKRKSVQYSNDIIANHFIENSNLSRHAIKKHALRNNILDYRCAICGNDGIWMGKSITLHIDHINGVNNDNRVENLRILCPNCHSQTQTYAGKNKPAAKMKPRTHKQRLTKFNASLEELQRHLSDGLSFVKIGKLYGVSDNAIRKRINKLKNIGNSSSG